MEHNQNITNLKEATKQSRTREKKMQKKNICIEKKKKKILTTPTQLNLTAIIIEFITMFNPLAKN